MATTRKTSTKASTKAAVLEDETTEEAVAEQTPKQIINEGISAVLDASGVGVQHARYKAMRAIAYTAFVNAINDGTFDELVEQAIAGLDELPSGWEMERSEKAEAEAKPAAKKAPAAKAAPAKRATKAAPAKAASPRKRPTR